MSMLTMINDASARLSLIQPTSVEASSDRQVIQLLALLNQAGRDLARSHAWTFLMEEATFNTVGSPAQPAAVPPDLDRFVPNSFFDRTTRRGVIGPITAQRWQAVQAQPVMNLVYLSFRERSGQFLMTPTPPAGHVIAYEYVSKYWAKDAGGTPKGQLDHDSDTVFFDEELLTLGLVWRFLRGKGLDYAEEMSSYGRELERARARDGGATALTTTPRPVDPSRINLPDGNFGVP